MFARIDTIATALCLAFLAFGLYPEGKARSEDIAAAKKAADAAVVACIEQYASPDLKSGDVLGAAYKSMACEDHVRRLYPGTRGDPAPGEPYPYPPGAPVARSNSDDSLDRFRSLPGGPWQRYRVPNY
jgi:hypothetical protein